MAMASEAYVRTEERLLSIAKMQLRLPDFLAKKGNALPSFHSAVVV